MPSHQSFRRDDGLQLCQQLATELFRLRSQSTALIVGKLHTPIANLFPKNPILLHEVFNDALLMLVHPASDRDDNKGKGIQNPAHRRILLPPPNVLTTNHLNEIEFFEHFAMTTAAA